jgi:hypothetical protein
MRVREFDGICSLAQADARLDCTDMNNPFAIVNVDARGAISTFDPELLSVQTDTYGDFVLGRVHSDSLVSIAASPKFQRILADMRAGTDRCRAECAYFGLWGRRRQQQVLGARHLRLHRNPGLPLPHQAHGRSGARWPGGGAGSGDLIFNRYPYGY